MSAELQPPAAATGTVAVRCCANCGAHLVGRYCHECGQSSRLQRSLLHFGEEMLHGLVHFDARGLRTLPLLALRPGVLTRRYIDGQRTRYVNPVVLFLFCIFLMFLVVAMTARSAPTAQVTPAQRGAALAEVDREVAADNAAVARATLALAQAQRSGTGVDEARSNLASARADQRVDTAVRQAMRIALPGASTAAGALTGTAWLATLEGVKVDTGHPLLDSALRRILADPYLFLFKLREAASRFAFLLVPISLPFLCLMFVARRDVAAYDHVVFSLYSLSFMSLLVIAITLLGRLGLGGTAAAALVAVPPVHMFAQLRGTYGLGAGGALWRALALLGVAGTTFLLFLSFIVVVALR